MSKSPDAFRTISEVAEDLDLPQHVLRFWETRFGQIRPLKRGGGRRYYRPDDIDLLRGIRHLLYGEGYTIRGVQRILKEQGARFVVGAGRGEFAGVPGKARAGEMGTSCPVFGLRPTRSPFERTIKEPKEESFTDSPRMTQALISSSTSSTRSADSVRDKPTFW